MRDERKHEQSAGIFAYIFSVVISLCDKKAHYRAGKSADDMQDNGQSFVWIIGESEPRDMVNRHCGNGDHFKCIGVQALFHFVAPYDKFGIVVGLCSDF